MTRIRQHLTTDVQILWLPDMNGRSEFLSQEPPATTDKEIKLCGELLQKLAEHTDVELQHPSSA
eukprot:5492926-Karenia_brevis.AAC.1